MKQFFSKTRPPALAALFLVGFLFLIPIIKFHLARPYVATYVELDSLERRVFDDSSFTISALAWVLALLISHPDQKYIRLLFGCTLTLTLIGAIHLGSIFIFHLFVIYLAFWFLFFRIGSLKIVLGISIPLLILIPWDIGRGSTRSYVGRVRADQRSLATAIEAYFMDNNTYPPHTYNYSKAVWQSKAYMPTFMTGPVGCLTTPMAYLNEYYLDYHFRRLDETRTFAYYTHGDNWIVLSAGPNCRFDLQSYKLEAIFATTETQETNAIVQKLIPYTYDPSNGADSPGDVWRIKQ